MGEIETYLKDLIQTLHLTEQQVSQLEICPNCGHKAFARKKLSAIEINSANMSFDLPDTSFGDDKCFDCGWKI
jgi:DNA-directed RNA polymerase subunit RPC12/RpoP